MKQAILNHLYYAGRRWVESEIKRGTPISILRECKIREKSREDEYFNRGITKGLENATN
jgi:hypothetical protein